MTQDYRDCKEFQELTKMWQLRLYCMSSYKDTSLIWTSYQKRMVFSRLIELDEKIDRLVEYMIKQQLVPQIGMCGV